MKRVIPALMLLLLGGCLETTEPVFDTTNARPLSELPSYMKVVAFFDEAEPMPDMAKGKTPRDLLKDGTVGVDLGDMALVQFPPQNGVYSYGTVGVLADRAFACFAAVDEQTQAAAKAYGITIEAPGTGGPQSGYRLSGDRQKMARFIRDQLAEGPLACFSFARKRPMAPG